MFMYKSQENEKHFIKTYGYSNTLYMYIYLKIFVYVDTYIQHNKYMYVY